MSDETPIANMLKEEMSQAVYVLLEKVEQRTTKVLKAAYNFVVGEARHPCPFGAQTPNCECAPHRARALLDSLDPRWAEYNR